MLGFVLGWFQLYPAARLRDRARDIAPSHAPVDKLSACLTMYPSQPSAMAVSPVLESSGFAEIKTREKRTAIEGKGLFERSVPGGALELMRVHLEGGAHPHPFRLRLQPVVAQQLAELVQLLVQGVARAFRVPLRPEERCERLPCGLALHGEIQQDGATQALRRKVG
jgi:hypothetical protein